MPKGYETISTFAPQQQQAFSQLLSMLNGLGGQGTQYWQELLSGSPEAFERFEAPYRRQFNEQIVPGIAERFAGVGGLSSSGFQQALGRASTDLSERLASLREGMRSQVPGQAMSGLQNLLGMNTQAFLPKQMPFWQNLLLGLSGGVGQGLGSLGSFGLGKFF